MTEPKTHCTNCGVQFLQRTADDTGGLCMPCHNRTIYGSQAEPVITPVSPLERGMLDQLIATTSPSCVIDALFDPACDKVNFRPSEMTEGDIIVYTVWTFLGETCNGGFVQYLGNQSGGWAHCCGNSLRRIGAHKYAITIEECIAEFTTVESPNDAQWEADLQVYWAAHDPPFPTFDSDDPQWQAERDAYEQAGPFYAAEQKFWNLHHADDEELTRILYNYIFKNRDVFAPFDFDA